MSFVLPLALSDAATVAVAAVAGLAGFGGSLLLFWTGEASRTQQHMMMRKDAYHLLYKSAQAEYRYWSQAERIETQGLERLQREAMEHLSGVYLVGTDDVVEAGKAWTKLAIEVDEEVGERVTAKLEAEGQLSRASITSATREVFSEHKERIDDGLDALMDAMRRDVGPE